MVVNTQKGIIRAQWGLPEKRLLYRFWSLLLVSSKSVLSTSLNFISCKLLLKLSLEVQLFCSIYGEVPLTCTLLVMFSTGEWFNMRDTKDTKSVYAEAINDLTVWGIGELTEDIRQHPVKLFYLLWEKYTDKNLSVYDLYKSFGALMNLFLPNTIYQIYLFHSVVQGSNSLAVTEPEYFLDCLHLSTTWHYVGFLQNN